MSSPGARTVIYCCFLIHFVWISGNFFVFQLSNEEIVLAIVSIQGLTYLCYPVLGWLADTRFTRYSMIKVAVVILLVISLMGLIVIAAYIIAVNLNAQLIYGLPWYTFVVLAIPLAIIIVAVGMFEANAIQFGMDQMLEASSDQLSTFIHWYYWSIHLSRGLMLLVSTCTDIVLRTCVIDLNIRTRTDANPLPGAFILFPVFLIQSVMTAVGLYLLQHHKRQLTIDPAGHTPFTTVYKVLKYAWQHKCPENRSAFTYWEEDIPSRINLGKNKYGGPFTTEEVEDTKTLFRILLLLFSLFGLHLADNGFTVTSHLVRKLCPSAVIFSATILASNIISSVTIVIGVPVLHYVIIPHFNKYLPNMLHRMGFGLMIILLQEAAGILIVLQTTQEYTNCPPSDLLANLRDCYLKNSPFLVNTTCTPLHLLNSYCGQGDTLFLWLLLPIALRSISYHFTFMTALEFICAQAPLRLKGLLIGVWYATSALQIHIFDTLLIVEDSQWFISHGIKCTLILLSLLLYCCIAKRYRYRVRDEVVPIYFLIEEKYEREFQLAEEYERERRAEMRALHGNARNIQCNSYGTN